MKTTYLTMMRLGHVPGHACRVADRGRSLGARAGGFGRDRRCGWRGMSASAIGFQGLAATAVAIAGSAPTANGSGTTTDHHSRHLGTRST